jgi:GTPase-associated system helical domain
MDIKQNLSRWLNPAIHNNQLSDKWYQARIKTTLSITKDIEVLDSLKLLRYFFDKSNDIEKKEIETKLQGTDISFENGQDFLNKLLVGVALMHVLSTSSYASDLIGLTTAAYTFQGNCFNQTETDVERDFRQISFTYLRNECRSVRNIVNFEAIEIDKTTIDLKNEKKNLEDPQPTTPELKIAFDTVFESILKSQKVFTDNLNKLNKSINEKFSELSTQNQITREETNFLWWVFGEFSRDLNKPLSEFNLPFGCLLIGKEASDLTEFLPGHYSAKAFLNKAINFLKTDNGVSNPAKMLSLAEVIESEQDWDINTILNGNIEKVIEFCPIHLALKYKAESIEVWKSLFENKYGIKPTKEFKALDISFQFYQERLLIRTL